MTKQLGCIAGMLLLAIGCQSPPDYSYSGRMLKADGSPASGLSLIVTPASAAIAGHPKGVIVTTDDGGGFSGSFANDMDGAGWARLPLPSMPPLAGVYLWVYDAYTWKPIPVSIDPLSEHQRCPGAQRIVLPTVTLPAQAREAGPITGTTLNGIK